MRRGAGEVDSDVLALDDDLDADRDRRVVEAVVVEHVLVIVGAIRDIADQPAEADPRALDQLDHRLVHDFLAEARQRLVIADGAEVERGELPANVAHHGIGLTRIGLDDRDERFVHFARLDEPHGRDQQAFLEELSRERRRAAGQHAPHVDLMRIAAAEARDPSTAVVGLHQDDVWRMRAAVIGVIEDEDVAVFHLLRRAVFQDFLHRHARTRELHREGEGLRDQPTRNVEQRTGGVADFADRLGMRRALQGRLHFLGDAVERVLDELDRDDVDRVRAGRLSCAGHCHAPTLMIRFSSSSTSTSQRGGMTVVEPKSSTMAGPQKRCPGCRASRL